LATLTTIVVGRIGDTVDSTANSIVDEVFTSVFDTPVKLLHCSFVAATTNVEDIGGGVPFTEGAGNDYVMDDANGTITVLSTGAMTDATPYEIDYDYNDENLAYKINAVTSPAQAAGKDYYVDIANDGGMGIAVIVTEI